jgi:Protein of unknown function (DUF3365)
MKSKVVLGITLALAAAFAACGKPSASRGITPQKMADALAAVMAADRAVYTREVVARLQDQESVIRASEHFRDDKALPLPAQMFRMGAEAAGKSRAGFTYALLSPWPINKQNAPRTPAEKEGLRSAVETGKSHYGEESLGGERYFTAVYPDKAVSEACVDCHNAHRDSPRHDFKPGDTMGGVVIRIHLD